ncbi:sensor histidine kinase [Flagellimonas meridianipacifica]|uniref:histidine kinase n=1 Tax=Flagellimonas meridianipacifica TaxID=1080225 RepID=A0A2T0MJG4_9FLAO|nr:sensor histidine kinase [Allomuricauda pacifica]PRX57695.1 signal transduction histidine kinase [Allomuricauda pacifica]
MLRIPVFLVSLLFTVSVVGQTFSAQQLDSLESLLPVLKTTKKVDLLCMLTKGYDGIDSSKTFGYGYQALKLSRKLGYDLGIAHANFVIGRAHMYDRPEVALKFLQKGDSLANLLMQKDSSVKLKKIWTSGKYNLGITHGFLGEHEKELEITYEVLPMVKEIEDSFQLANIYTNLGIKNINLGDYSEAKNSLLLGREIYRKLNDPKELTFNLIQLASVYKSLDSLELAQRFFKEAKSHLEGYPNKFDAFHFHLEKSQFDLEQRRFELALSELEQSMALIPNDTLSLQYSLIVQRMAKIHSAMYDHNKAKEYINLYIRNSSLRNDGIGIFKGYYQKSKYEAAAKDYNGAYKDLLRALDIYDSVETENTVRKINDLELQYKSAENERALLELKSEKDRADLALERQRANGYLLALIIGVLVFTALMAYLFYRNKLRKVRRMERIRESELERLKQEQQNKIFSAMIEGQEKERKRLAIDLHDGLGGRLSGISLNLSKLDKDQPAKYPKERLKKVVDDLDASLQELRTIARNLMPETLVKFGLKAALNDYCSNMTGGGTTVMLQYYGEEEGIPLSHQVTIFRIIQELINNAVKHAGASEVLIQYIRDSKQVHITVEDNGIGIPDEVLAENEGKGMGLGNLRTRVAYLKGKLDFHSDETEGTTVNIHFELDAA